MKKTIVLGIFVVLLLVGGFFGLNSYIYNQKQGNGIADIKAYRGTLSGEYICLPKLPENEFTSGNCQPGMKTETNEVYLVDFKAVSQVVPELKVGDRFSASGNITPTDLLSTDYWNKYGIKGIFGVTDSVKKL